MTRLQNKIADCRFQIADCRLQIVGAEAGVFGSWPRQDGQVLFESSI